MTDHKLPTVGASTTPLSARKQHERNDSNSALGTKPEFYNSMGKVRSIKAEHALSASPVQKLFDKNKETVEEMLVRKFRAKYIDSNPAFQQDLGELERANPTGMGMGHTRYLSLKQKGVFDKVNQSVSLPQKDDQQPMKNNYFSNRHASVGNRQASVTTLLPKLQGKEPERNAFKNSVFERTRNSSINVVENRDLLNPSPLKGRTNNAQELLAYIINEVRRFVATKRLSESNLFELDQKI